MARSQQGADQHNIQHDGCCGSGGETVERVQHAPHQGDQRHEQQVGEGNLRQLDGEGEFIWLVDEPWRDDIYEPWHRQQGG